MTALPARFEAAGDPVPLGPDLVEYRFRGTLREDPSLALELRFRLSDLSPIVRFQYRLTATKPHAFSRSGAQDEIEYLATSFDGLPRAREMRLSEFVELLHSYTLSERPVDPDDFEAGLGVMGPILVASDGRRTMLLAYEHGSQAPDAFLRFDLGRRRSVSLRGVKGNYWRGQVVDADHPYETVWLQAGLVAGDEDAAAEAYRRFVARGALGERRDPRAPRPLQHLELPGAEQVVERRSRYLESMNAERMLAEIDVAARMGIETFVLDTGWYEKTGDWAVSRARFPDGLAPLKAKLDAHGMKLGLWFNPTAAAVSSRAGEENAAFRMSWKGESKASPVWETEESYPMCLVSPWGEAFLKELVRLHRETGVTYYKWDAVGQYGCDAPGHGHGTAANTPEERADSYAFRIGAPARRDRRAAGRAGPGRGGGLRRDRGRPRGRARLPHRRPLLPGQQRAVLPELRRAHRPPEGQLEPLLPQGGGAHLDHPLDLRLRQVDPVRALPDPLLPGRPRGLAARERRLADPRPRRHLGRPACRSRPRASRASGRILGLWRQVRDAMAAASPVRTGPVGGSGEVHEKIEHETGRGAIVLFSTASGRQRYVSEHPVVEPFWATPGTTVTLDASGHAIVDAAFAKPGAAIVFFGAREGRQ